MTIKTVYVCAKSKKEANEQVLNGTCYCSEYTLVGEREENIRSMATGTVVKIFSKYVGGQPYAKSYGVWDATKKQIK